ncbi:MAG: hypothetical protein ABL883_11870 [Terricaulis sp.]
MKGVILGYDMASATGVILGEDQNRYNFDRRQWRSQQQPAGGAQVDFLASGNSAEDVYATASGAAVFSGDFSNVLSNFLLRPSLVLAALILLGCILPLFSLTNMIASVGRGGPVAAIFAQLALPGEPSLIGLADLWSKLLNFARMSGNQQDPVGLWIWLPYLIPLVAGALLAVELRDRDADTRVLQVVAGLCAFVLPIGAYFLFVLPAFAKEADGPQSVPWSIGAFLIAGGGLFLLLNAFGALSNLQPGQTAAHPYQPPPSPTHGNEPQSAGFAIDAPSAWSSGGAAQSGDTSYAPDEPPPRSGLPPAAWAAIALVALGLVGGGGFFVWRTVQAQQEAAAIDQAWAQVARDDPAALRGFIGGTPGSHKEEAEAALNQLEQTRYAAAQAMDTIEALRAFADAFPGTQNAMNAQGRIGELEQLAAMTAPLLGVWAGNVLQGNSQYEIGVTLRVEGRALRGSAQYPMLQCFAAWEGGDGSAARGSPWAMNEAMQVSNQACPSGRQVTLTLLPDGSLALAYLDPATGMLSASGSLIRQADPAAAPAMPTP